MMKQGRIKIDKVIDFIALKQLGKRLALPPKSGAPLPRRAHALTFAAFLALLLTAGILSAALPKPEVSQIENRPLERPPALTVQTLFSGDATDGFSLFYSDTFPLREWMIETASGFRSLFGIRGSDEAAIHFGVGSAEGKDGNVPGTQAGGGSEAGTETNAPGTEVGTDPDAGTPHEGTGPSAGQTNPGGEASAPGTAGTPATPGTTDGAGGTGETGKDGSSFEETELEGEGDVRGGLIVIGDTALEFYGFSKSANTAYADSVNAFDEKHQGKVLTSVMVVPTNAEFKMPRQYSDLSSDQGKAIRFLYDRLRPGIQRIDVYDALKQHAGEYIYFRTDHHWTALGAYYAYREYCAQRGFPCAPLGNYSQIRLDGFLGSLYNAVGGDNKMKKNPDFVLAYKPIVPYEMLGYPAANGRGETWKLSLVREPEEIPGRNKYLAFSGGDLPYIRIQTQAGTGRKLLVVKESYANAFIPFLTENYDEIHVVDFRYYTGNVDSLIAKHGIGEALFLNYVSAAGSKAQVGKLTQMLRQ
ncbi:MAG: hypothetical protein LBD12_04385 [Clostridiales Family XIII bacterium]|jgi:hypothetical protein|nr:hypothetical protein [Clostridiales Family XIII bacterium]